MMCSCKVLRAKEDGTPTDTLKAVLAPQLKIEKVKWFGKGPCESTPEPPPSTSNFPPAPRNQVDLLNATVGELLVYIVPEVSKKVVLNFGLKCLIMFYINT